MLAISFRLFVGACVLSASVSCFSADPNQFSPPPLSVPDGFTIELVAAPPLVKYPMMACFDERGRLFVAETLGQNLAKKELLEKSQRFIRMLEDTDRDGKFDKSTIFADKLVMPEGALWYRGSLYVLSSPYLWRFEDTNDDGVADVREKLVGYMDFTGQANQHGAYLGPNGRLYFSGGHLGYDLTGKDGVHVAKGRAAAVFSCWDDGTDVQVFGNGGINPVEVAFTPEGELLTTCPIFDSIGGRHDALIHWVRGATAGPKDYAPPVLKQTGYRIPSVRRWGQVAPSGLARYRSKSFGGDYQNSFFATHFNTATVVNTQLKRVGSTFEGIDHDFMTSASRDFHPTDVVEDADGSLLIVDTGGWFLISCPFSKVSKPEIMGAIYRVKRKGEDGPADPRGIQIDWTDSCDELLRYLDDARPAVRDQAIETLAARGDEAVAAAKVAWDGLSEQARRNAVWAISRVNSEASRGQLRFALGDLDDSVVHAATRSVGIAKDGLGVTSLFQVLQSSSWPNRRAAASALGEIGDATAVPYLLSALAEPGDDHLRHALVYALIEIGDQLRTAAGLESSDPSVQHAALVALDQMRGSPLTREQVAPLLGSGDERVRRTALQIVAARAGWTDEMIGILEDWMAGAEESASSLEFIPVVVSAFHGDGRVQQLVADALGSNPATEVTGQLFASIGRVRELPTSWLSPLRELLHGGDESLQSQLIAAINASRTTQLNTDLLKVGRAASNSKDVRVAAWICLAETGASLPDQGFHALLKRTRTRLPLDRLAAGRAIARAELTRSQLMRLIAALPDMGASELPMLLEKAENEIENAPELGPQFDEVARRAAIKLRTLGTTDVEVQQRIRNLLNTLKAGDRKHGEAIFFSNRAACSACHTVNGVGGDAGPDLSRIGLIRRRADLLEAVLYPSATIVNSYETYTVLTHDGRTEQGVIQRADARWLVLRDAQRREVTIARDQIAELTRAAHSIMPQGLETNLNSDELSDLLAFLGSLGKEAGE